MRMDFLDSKKQQIFQENQQKSIRLPKAVLNQKKDTYSKNWENPMKAIVPKSLFLATLNYEKLTY